MDKTGPEQFGNNQKGKHVQSLAQKWASLGLNQRITLIATIAVTIIGVGFLARSATQPSMSLLYSSLEPSAAGDIVSSLDGQGVVYEVRGNSVYVDSSQRDQLRLTLASQGLPANSTQGYELLDTLSGFGTTSQMFDAAYLRAKEGELARTIVANPNIKAARVHLAQSRTSPFRKSASATASVSIQSNGHAIGKGTANSIRFLVASAVAGLVPEAVSVIDADRGVLLDAETGEDLDKSAQDRAKALKQNVERLIEARTGLGNAVVEVNVETLSEDETIVERTFDPDGRVIVSTETAEKSSSSRNLGGAGVTVASNLPTGDGANGSQEASAQDSDTREIVNYEISETQREVRRAAGSIKRISVAVLVDGVRGVDDTGTESWKPRSEEELRSLEALIKSAVGYDAQRGDEVTIRSMDLAVGESVDVTSEDGWATGRSLDYFGLVKTAVAGMVVLGLGLFVVRPIMLAGGNATPPIELDGTQAVSPLTGEITSPSELAQEQALVSNNSPADEMAQAGMPSVGASSDPVARLKALIEERQEETIAVLKNWIEEPNEVAKS